MAIKDLLNSWIVNNIPNVAKEKLTSVYSKMKSDLHKGGLPEFNIPVFKVSPLDSAVIRDMKYNPVSLQIDPNDSVITSHELGHLTDFKTNKFNVNLYKLLDKLPLLHHAGTLLKERNANKVSWKLIKDSYKDDPELIKQFGALRSKTLPKAYATYLSADGLPLLGTLGLGALGAKIGYASGKNEDVEVDPRGKSYDEIEREIKRKQRDNKAVGAVTLATLLGLLGYKVSNAGSMALTPVTFNKLQKYINSSEYKSGLKTLNKSIQNFKSKEH